MLSSIGDEGRWLALLLLSWLSMDDDAPRISFGGARIIILLMNNSTSCFVYAQPDVKTRTTELSSVSAPRERIARTHTARTCSSVFLHACIHNRTSYSGPTRSGEPSCCCHFLMSAFSTSIMYLRVSPARRSLPRFRLR